MSIHGLTFEEWIVSEHCPADIRARAKELGFGLDSMASPREWLWNIYQREHIASVDQVAPPSVNKLDGDDYTVDAKELTEDAKVFGVGQWVYCNQHLRPHETGWCTVSARDKIGLGVSNSKDAYEKCQAWGLRIYNVEYPFERHTHFNIPTGFELSRKEPDGLVTMPADVYAVLSRIVLRQDNPTKKILTPKQLIKRAIKNSREIGEGDCVYCGCEQGGGHNGSDCYPDCPMEAARALVNRP